VPFYFPDPDQFGHPDAYALFTAFASRLEEIGLGPRFPADDELRHITIELLAEQTTVEEIELDPTLVDAAVIEARSILENRPR
jgi:hypothetical protein